MATSVERRQVEILVFDGFEILDVMGPVELFGMHPDAFDIHLVAEGAGPVTSFQGSKVYVDRTLSETAGTGVVLVPGGQGTRQVVENGAVLDWILKVSRTAELLTSVCTGSALLARAGVLDGRRATSNKMSFDWVITQGPEVNWVHSARWVRDERLVTSSGVSAGMDMTLDIIAGLLGMTAANDAARWAEYEWHRDSEVDPFAEDFPHPDSGSHGTVATHSE